MKTIKGQKYSRKSFDGYGYRARIVLEVAEIKNHKVETQKIGTDIYTTENDSRIVKKVFFERCAENVIELKVVGWVSRAEDEATTKFLKEILDEDEN